MNIQEILNQSEGRRLEFKTELPEHSGLTKTMTASVNDAGGGLYIGVADEPHKVVGLDEDRLMAIEERINNIIFDRCCPAILPEIKFISEDNRHLIQVTVFRDNTSSYYLKNEGKLQGTFICVDSTNRLTDESIISKLERRKRNISFDSEAIPDKPVNDLNIDNFETMFEEKAGEELSDQELKKLNLVKDMQGVEYLTNALILFSDDSLRNSLFRYAKAECARSKGVTTEDFIDQKSITTNIATRAEEAYNFVLRHINREATAGGVYTVSRWEYPVEAVREATHGIIVHRDYSLIGKDVKVAIYDDMVEVTSPGLLPPSISYAAIEDRQSDARDRVIVPIFKRLSIIDQWGNGLKLIADELGECPNIKLRWKEIGLSFQVRFVNMDISSNTGTHLGIDVGNVGIDVDSIGINVSVGTSNNEILLIGLIRQNSKITVKGIADTLKLNKRQCERIIANLKHRGILSRKGTNRTEYWIIAGL